MNHEDSDSRWVLYGAYGFTGRMILDNALALGLRPVIAGRSHEKVAALAQRHGLQQCEASVDNAGALERCWPLGLTWSPLTSLPSGPRATRALRSPVPTSFGSDSLFR